MANLSGKRTLDAFFTPPNKKAKVELRGNEEEVDQNEEIRDTTNHATYPFAIPHLPYRLSSALESFPSSKGKHINDQAHLDLVYFKPYVPKSLERELFTFLRRELFFYRVEYKIRRGGIESQIRTPRYTTVFGLDNTSRFDEFGQVVDAETRSNPQKNDKNYAKYPPRPLPKCLDDLRVSTESTTGCTFNFCLVNYYASGSDSISYHSDDERFLGPLPAIASFSLGATRDFLMKHKPIPPKDDLPPPPETKPIKLPLGSGDMVLMKGETQANWLHSLPKRSGKNEYDGGRINITFRKALVRGGTENYYNYNVGVGPIFKWNERAGEMQLWVK